MLILILSSLLISLAKNPRLILIFLNISFNLILILSLKRINFLPNWINTSLARYYTTAQYTTLINNTTDLRTTIPGVTSITINTPVNNSSVNYYLIAPAYKSTVNY